MSNRILVRLCLNVASAAEGIPAEWLIEADGLTGDEADLIAAVYRLRLLASRLEEPEPARKFRAEVEGKLARVG